ncbi:MAG TPA: HgcAB-associated protein [Methanospirillum sp.]|nr:HgcAB-associated protein [Methanospirillum sp.]
MTENNEHSDSPQLCGCSETCRIEAILTIDERGQMVIPKEVRENTGIKPGEKLALTSWSRDGEVCCLVLIRTGRLSEMVKDMLSPLAESILKREL